MHRIEDICFGTAPDGRGLYYVLYFMCMSVLLACMFVYYMYAWWPQRSEMAVGFLEIVNCHEGAET